MATTPRPHQTPSPRASSAREDDKARDARHARSAARPDPSHLPPEKRVPDTATQEESSPVARENPPQPQQGMSSSELNSAAPNQKAKATEEAKGNPDNTDPK